MIARYGVICIICLVFMVTSCASGTKVSDTTPPSTKIEKSRSIPSYEVPLLDDKILDSLIRNREGKVLLLNVWATWCIPCRQEFPDLIKLAHAYEGTNVEIVGVSADYPDDIETRIKPFLEQSKSNFTVYVQNFEQPEDIINRLNVEWSGAIPATFIYDASGNQRAFLLGKKSFEEFQAAIEQVRKPTF